MKKLIIVLLLVGCSYTKSQIDDKFKNIDNHITQIYAADVSLSKLACADPKNLKEVQDKYCSKSVKDAANTPATK